MKRAAITGILALFVILAVSLFVPMVPSSATAKPSSGSPSTHPCVATMVACIYAGESIQGYGSISYYLVGRGAFYYQGNYQVMTNSNFTISVS